MSEPRDPAGRVARWCPPPGAEREFLQKVLYEVEDTFEIRWRDFVRREGEFQPRPGETPVEAAERHRCFTLEPTDPKLVDAMSRWQDESRDESERR